MATTTKISDQIITIVEHELAQTVLANRALKEQLEDERARSRELTRDLRGMCIQAEKYRETIIELQRAINDGLVMIDSLKQLVHDAFNPSP